MERIFYKHGEREQEIIDYVQKHRGVSVTQVSDLFNVSAGEVYRMVRDNKMQFTEESIARLHCEKCNKTDFRWKAM